MSNREWWIGIGVLAFIGVGLRALLVVWLPAQPIDDFWSYLERAGNLLGAGVYGAFPTRPDAAYPPAYPLLLAGVLALGGEAVTTAKLVNVGLGLISTILAGLLGRRWGGREAGWMAAALIAVLPRGVLESQILASENLLQPVLFGFVLIATPPKTGAFPLARVGVAGVLLGVATMTRVAVYGLWILWPIAVWIAGRRTVVRETVVLVSVLHLVLVPWALRNLNTLGEWRWLTSTGGINLFIGYHDEATGSWTPWREALSRTVPDLDRLTVLEVDKAAAMAAREWIARHPVRSLELVAIKLRKLVCEDEHYVLFYSLTGRGGAPYPQEREVVRKDHPLRRAAGVVLAVLNLAYVGTGGLGLLGLVRVVRSRPPAGRRRWLAVLWLGGGALYFVAVGAVFFAATRFRWPAMDLLIIAAALGVTRFPRPHAERGAKPTPDP